MDSTDPEPRRSLLADLLLELVRETGLPVALIGGQAINHWARPRYTDDFDFTVAADTQGITKLVARLVDRGFRVVRNDAAGSPSGPDFVRLERGEREDAIDIAVAKTEYQDLVISRAITADDHSLPFATPEDLIVMKLIANRSKDHDDIFRIIESQAIDWEYIEHWASIWQVSNTLAELREIAARPSGLPE